MQEVSNRTKPVIFNDIYFKVGTGLMENNYYELSIEDKKNLIETELRKYIICKLGDLRRSDLIPENFEELNVGSMVELLASIIPSKEHDKTIAHFTHYILAIASEIQRWQIDWHIENSKQEVNFDKVGIWDKLITSAESYVEVFKFVWDIFVNHFMVKSGKQRILLSDTLKNNNDC